MHIRPLAFVLLTRLVFYAHRLYRTARITGELPDGALKVALIASPRLSLFVGSSSQAPFDHRFEVMTTDGRCLSFFGGEFIYFVRSTVLNAAFPTVLNAAFP